MCEYCEYGDEFSQLSGAPGCFVFNPKSEGNPRLEVYMSRKLDGIEVGFHARIPIDFCPKCGRDLRGEKK